jgi:C4-dicarboxylate transporter, DctQ subunit
VTVEATAGEGWLARAERWGRRVEDLLLTLLLLGLVLLASGQIVLRNVFSVGVLWADGLVRLLVLWLALIGAIAASRDQKHIAVDALARVAPPLARRLAAVLSSLFTSAITGILAFYSWRFVADSRAYGDTLLSDWPAWICELILPLGFALISYRYLVRAARQLRVPD